MPKRVGHLYEKMLDRHFIRNVILKAVKGRTKRRDCALVMRLLNETIDDIYFMLDTDTYEPSKYSLMVIYDQSSMKYRDIKTVPFNPDCIIQWMIVEVARDSVFMRGMDYWCSASIPGRGGNRIYKGIRKYIRHHKHRDKSLAVSIDIRHFYASIDIRVLMRMLRRRIKDERFLRLVEKILLASSDNGYIGIAIGYHLNQWLANFYLEEMDRIIRRSRAARWYGRYMDNMTIIGSNKRKLRSLIRTIWDYAGTIGLSIKSDYQIYRLSRRPIQAVGYRYAEDGHVILKKRNWLLFRRQILRISAKQREGAEITAGTARGFMTRFGSMKKHAPSGRIFGALKHIDFADIRRKAAA